MHQEATYHGKTFVCYFCSFFKHKNQRVVFVTFVFLEWSLSPAYGTVLHICYSGEIRGGEKKRISPILHGSLERHKLGRRQKLASAVMQSQRKSESRICPSPFRRRRASTISDWLPKLQDTSKRNIRL